MLSAQTRNLILSKSKTNNLASCWLSDLAMSSLAILMAYTYNSWLYVWAATFIFSSHLLSHSLSTFVGNRVAACWKPAMNLQPAFYLSPLSSTSLWIWRDTSFSPPMSNYYTCSKWPALSWSHSVASELKLMHLCRWRSILSAGDKRRCV